MTPVQRFHYPIQGVINSHRVTCVRWVPGSEDLFIASYEDGTMYIVNKDRSDPTQAVSEKEYGKLPFTGYVDRN